MKQEIDTALFLILTAIGKRVTEIPFSEDNYKHFEQYTNCEHKKNNELSCVCKECNITWLIERCRALEKAIAETKKALGIEE